MLPNFSRAAGGMYPRKCSIFPPAQGGGAAHFFVQPPGAYTRNRSIIPLVKGGDAACFFFQPLHTWGSKQKST